MISNNKYNKLTEYIKSFGSVTVAFSGGVDSTLLLRACVDALGSDCVVAVTASSALIPDAEAGFCEAYCKDNGIKHISHNIDIFDIDGLCDNPPDRCYICKKHIFSEIISVSKSCGIDIVVEGSNLDDDNDYRPGMRAVKELGVISPFKAVEITKNDIRDISQQLGIAVWNKPSSACLASRIAYGEKITKESLTMIDRSEEYLKSVGFTQFRVRKHDSLARIEVLQSEMSLVMSNKNEIYDYLKSLGFSYVTLDLAGYRTGSMNEVL